MPTLPVELTEWKGRLGCYCYDCWKWCKKGNKEEYDTFFKKKFVIQNTS